MDKRIYTIGRDESCDICLFGAPNSVSRHHAVLKICKDGKYVLIDQSLNGTFINGVRIQKEREVPVSRKDRVSFANEVFLDWSLIPDGTRRRRRLLFVGISAGVLVVAAVIIGSILVSSPGVNGDNSTLYDIYARDSVETSDLNHRSAGVDIDSVDKLFPMIQKIKKENKDTVTEIRPKAVDNTMITVNAGDSVAKKIEEPKKVPSDTVLKKSNLNAIY